MQFESQVRQLLLLEHKPIQAAAPLERLPAPCSMQSDSVESVLRAVDYACAVGNQRDVSILVAVNNSHAVVAHGHDVLTRPVLPGTQSRTLHRLLPALGAVFGSPAEAASVMARTNVGSHADKAQRRKIRRQARSEAMRKLSAHISFALILDWASTLRPLSGFDAMRKQLTHAVSVDSTGIEFERHRVTVGADGVHGPAPPTRAMLSQFVDNLHLDLGQRLQRLPVEARSEASEGVGLVRNLRRVLSDRLSFLFEAGAVRDDAALNFTLFFRLGGDFGHCARFTINNVPYLVDTVGLVADPAVFELGCATAVSELLVFMLARERDQLDSVLYYSELRCNALLSLSEPIVLWNEAGEVAHSVVCQVSCRSLMWLLL